MTFPQGFLEFLRKYEEDENCSLEEYYDEYFKFWVDGYKKGRKDQWEEEHTMDH